MAEPNRKQPYNIEPDIRPNLHVVKGGGETTPDRANLQPVDNSTAQDLNTQENRLGVIQGGGESTPERGNLSAVPNENINAAQNGERNGGNWQNNFSGKTTGNKKSGDIKGFLKKKGPTGAIIGLFVGGGFGLSTLLTPGIALIHIKETLVNKFDTMSSVNDTRGALALGDRMFSTSGVCGAVITIKCRYSGLTEREMSSLKDQGAQLLDADGNPVTKNSVTRKYTGGKTLVLPPAADGTPGERVDVTDYYKKILSSKTLRDTMRVATRSRFASWASAASKYVREKFKLDTNPNWGEDDTEKAADTAIYDAESGESYSASAEANTPPDKTDPNTGKPVPPAADPASLGLDFGPDADDINTLATKLEADASAGTPDPQLPSDPAEVAAMPDYVGASTIKTGLSKALGFLNPASIFVGLCTAYQLTNITVITAKTIGLFNAMRYASIFLSTADKAKALPADNPLTTSDISKPMNLLETPNAQGDAFGDSFSYNDAEYGTVTDQPIASSANGNSTIQLLSSIMTNINNALGGKHTVQTACNILTNPFVQGALALTSFIPGPGALFDALKGLVSEGGMAAAKAAITEQISSFVAKNLTTDALKTATKAATKGLLKMARGPLALFLAGVILTKYGVPYIARIISNADLPSDGASAMDMISNGTDATEGATASESGLVPLTKSQATAFNQFNQTDTNEYVADMEASSNPFDLTNPYSAASNFTAALYPLISKFNIGSQQGFASILSAPAAILSSLNPGTIAKSTDVFASNTSAELSYCQDPYLQSQNIATNPDCNPIYGYPDLGMLQTEDPNAVNTWLLTHDQVDDTDTPVSGSDLANFLQLCVTDSSGKMISDLGDSSQQLDSSCYGSKNETQQWEMFRLYAIDNNLWNFQENDP